MDIDLIHLQNNNKLILLPAQIFLRPFNVDAPECGGSRPYGAQVIIIIIIIIFYYLYCANSRKKKPDQRRST